MNASDKKEKYFDQIARLETIVEKNPSEVDIGWLVEYLTANHLEREFFELLSNPAWIQPFFSNGFFSNPPDPIRKENYIQYPIWPESRYLLRVVDSAPLEVLRIALSLPDSDNERIHEDFTEAARKMSPDLAAKWADIECDWVQRHDHLSLNLPLHLGDLIQHLAEGGKNNTALRLAKALLFLQPDPQYEDKVRGEQKYKESDFYLPYYPTPYARCDLWEYEKILQRNIPSLVTSGGVPAFEWLCKLLSNAFRLSRRDDEIPEKPGRDFSYISRPAIEEHKQNRTHDIKDAIIDAVRNAAEQLIDRDRRNLALIVKILDNEATLPWSIFRRIAMHQIRVSTHAPKKMVSQFLAKKRYLTYPEYAHEYHLLAEEKFGLLSPENQSSVLKWVMQGEVRRKKALVEWYQENEQRDPSPEEIEDGVRVWLLETLDPFKRYLHGDLNKRYEDAFRSKGKSDHPEFPFYSRSWVGPTSPKTSKELSDWPVQTLLDYLQTWQPKNESMSDSRDGLADSIAAAVGGRPQKYAQYCDQFSQLHPQLHPKYIRGFIEGFHEAARNDHSFQWSPVLALCQWVTKRDRNFSEEVMAQEIGDGREETSWAWTLKRIANLLEEGLKEKKSAEIPSEDRETVWSILEVLANDLDPSSRDEHRIMQPFDPATISINTVRGQAMHTVMHFIMWVRKHFGEQGRGEKKPVLDFKIMPEVRRLLERRLDRRVEKTLTIQSVYAKWFPWLVAWDSRWSKLYMRKIFPGRPSLKDHWKTAWGTYVVYNRPYDNVFRLMKRNYRKAIDHPETFNVQLIGASSADENLAEHIMTFYWRGLIVQRSGSLLNHFFDKAPPELRGHAIGFVGESIANSDASIHKDIMQRFYALWSWRLKRASKSEDLSQYQAELMAFGKWFGTQKLQPTEWALDQVQIVLEKVGRIDADEAMVKYLSVIAADFPLKVIRCFQIMVMNETDDYNMWQWKEHGRKLLSTVIEAANPDARDLAINLVHRLGARGYKEYRELVED